MLVDEGLAVETVWKLRREIEEITRENYAIHFTSHYGLTHAAALKLVLSIAMLSTVVYLVLWSSYNKKARIRHHTVMRTIVDNSQGDGTYETLRAVNKRSASANSFQLILSNPASEAQRGYVSVAM